ncbi:unnamed protein product [Acanthoscelides obtectus]|uniref:Uncharacterized protein n=1 Tax=Acanthoscelides obtectus TaxID=200917 RepID=A0A9P0L6C1_ACAOB|nr:unnamed protein product [Acanthoscelides obtectus]CAK1649508.1 hypothetical protein AOBTE_LOCUS16281 [Acanthoscelides obtectus]
MNVAGLTNVSHRVTQFENLPTQLIYFKGRVHLNQDILPGDIDIGTKSICNFPLSTLEMINLFSFHYYRYMSHPTGRKLEVFQ